MIEFGNTFSPLLIGVAVVTCGFGRIVVSTHTFSPLLIGVAVVTCGFGRIVVSTHTFSPLLIGVAVVTNHEIPQSRHGRTTFSPLLIGVAVVTSDGRETYPGCVGFQSPFNRGSSCNTMVGL